MSETDILIIEGLTRSYRSGSRSLTVLNEVSFRVPQGSACAIVGPSGSGKSTLLGLAAGLDQPSSGTVTLCGTDLASLDEDRRAELRAEKIGFVFQSFRLIPTLTALENVMVPEELQGKSGAHEDAARLLDRVGLGDRLDHYPAQLSGGEQQRVAIARAFINRPAVLFADEPTGNLDGRTSQAIIELLFELNRDAGTTLILVTHDHELASRTGRIISLRDGEVVSDHRDVEAVTV